MLCRAHGATAAYTPMLHARLFAESATYRREHFTTTDGDRPLFVQFCANDPDIFVTAARYVQVLSTQSTTSPTLPAPWLRGSIRALCLPRGVRL